MKRMNQHLTLFLSLLLLSSLLFASCGNRPAPVSPEPKPDASSGAEKTPEAEPVPESEPSAVNPAADDGKSYYEMLMEQLHRESALTREVEEKNREAGLARYAELEKELEAFDAAHDINRLSEEENIQRIAITDEMLRLEQLYINEPYQPTDAEIVEQTIGDRLLVYNDYLYYKGELGKKSFTTKSEIEQNSLKNHMEQYLVKYNYLVLMEKEYRAGKDPKGLMIEFDRFNQKLGYGDWKDILTKEPYWDEVWNGGELIDGGDSLP